MAIRDSSSQPRFLVSVDDIAGSQAADVFARARAIMRNGRPSHVGLPFTLGLFFLQSSLRTRVGFAAAASRLGGQVIDIPSLRFVTGMSEAECFADTLRTASGMLDILVTRTPFNLDGTDLSDNCKCPLINGGDAALRHPTQTLIDLFAISEFRGELSDLRLAICGDLQTRATRSFLAWLTRHPPRMLKLIAPKSRSNHGLRLNEALLRVTEVSDRMQLQDIDVVYMTGLAQGEGEAYLSADDRSPFILTTDTIRELPVDAIVLSPMPLIDEIDRVVLHDERMRVFAQSDLGVPVRMAIIELLLLPWINKNSS